MKGKPRPPFYFSAYRLKTLEEAASPASGETMQSPYLRAILSGKTRTINRVKVFPMINPYKEKMASLPAGSSHTGNNKSDTGTRSES